MSSPLRAHPVLALLVLAALAGCAGESKGANTAPVADLAVVAGEAPNVWILDGSKSTDPDGDALTYHWNWALGNTSTTESKIQVEFPQAVAAGNANYLVSLVVRDADGEPALALGSVKFGTGVDNTPPMIMLTEGPRWVKPGSDVMIDASTSMDAESDALAYEWIWGPRGTYDPKATGVADPCAEADDRLATFSTGCLAQDQSYNQTFDQAGTFNIHCHPHPWMKARIVVDASMPAESRVYEIANFGYPETVTVGVGSTLEFVNLDPVAHTATIEDWIPGTLAGGETPVFKQNLGEGEYVVRLIVTDAKGGRATQTWGLKASPDAPENPQVASWPAPTPLGPNQQWAKGFYNLSFEASITATLSWTDPTPAGTAFLGNFTVGRVDPDGSFTPQNQCVAKREQGLAGEPPALTMSCVLRPDKYVFKVVANEKGTGSGNPGFLPDWDLSVGGIVRTNPGFGDSGGASDGHGHHH